MTNLYRCRIEKRLTQQQLAEASGVCLESIRKYEQERNDISNISLRSAVAFAKTLKVPIDYLLDDRKFAEDIRNLEKYRRFFR